VHLGISHRFTVEITLGLQFTKDVIITCACLSFNCKHK